ERQIETFRPGEGATEDGHADADQDQRFEDVLQERVDIAGAARQQDESGDQSLDDERDHADEQDDKAAKDEDVKDAGVEVAKHSFLDEGVLKCSSQATTDLVESRLRRASEEHPNPPAHRVGKGEYREEDGEAEDHPSIDAKDQALCGKGEHRRGS